MSKGLPFLREMIAYHESRIEHHKDRIKRLTAVEQITEAREAQNITPEQQASAARIRVAADAKQGEVTEDWIKKLAKPSSRNTTDPTDPRLTHGVDDEPTEQAETYLVLSEEERAKGFVRPVRHTYTHLEEYGGCGMATTMGQAIAETYARTPSFYGSTYCVGCRMHLPVGDFVWDGTMEKVGS